MATRLIERERAVLQVIERLGGRASFDVIETRVEARFRKRLWPTLIELAGRGYLTRREPGTYALMFDAVRALEVADQDAHSLNKLRETREPAGVTDHPTRHSPLDTRMLKVLRLPPTRID